MSSQKKEEGLCGMFGDHKEIGPLREKKKKDSCGSGLSPDLLLVIPKTWYFTFPQQRRKSIE